MPPADDAAGNFHEHFMDECEAFEARAQAPEVMQPGDESAAMAAAATPMKRRRDRTRGRRLSGIRNPIEKNRGRTLPVSVEPPLTPK